MKGKTRSGELLFVGWILNEIGDDDTVDGRNLSNQLRFVAYPMISRVYTSQVVVWDFFHQRAPQKCKIDKQKLSISKKSQLCQIIILGMLGFRDIRQIVSWALRQGIYLLAAKWENQAP